MMQITCYRDSTRPSKTLPDEKKECRSASSKSSGSGDSNLSPFKGFASERNTDSTSVINNVWKTLPSRRSEREIRSAKSVRGITDHNVTELSNFSVINRSGKRTNVYTPIYEDVSDAEPEISEPTSKQAPPSFKLDYNLNILNHLYDPSVPSHDVIPQGVVTAGATVMRRYSAPTDGDCKQEKIKQRRSASEDERVKLHRSTSEFKKHGHFSAVLLKENESYRCFATVQSGDESFVESEEELPEVKSEPERSECAFSKSDRNVVTSIRANSEQENTANSEYPFAKSLESVTVRDSFANCEQNTSFNLEDEDTIEAPDVNKPNESSNSDANLSMENLFGNLSSEQQSSKKEQNKQRKNMNCKTKNRNVKQTQSVSKTKYPFLMSSLSSSPAKLDTRTDKAGNNYPVIYETRCDEVRGESSSNTSKNSRRVSPNVQSAKTKECFSKPTERNRPSKWSAEKRKKRPRASEYDSDIPLATLVTSIKRRKNSSEQENRSRPRHNKESTQVCNSKQKQKNSSPGGENGKPRRNRTGHQKSPLPRVVQVARGNSYDGYDGYDEDSSDDDSQRLTIDESARNESGSDVDDNENSALQSENRMSKEHIDTSSMQNWLTEPTRKKIAETDVSQTRYTLPMVGSGREPIESTESYASPRPVQSLSTNRRSGERSSNPKRTFESPATLRNAPRSPFEGSAFPKWTIRSSTTRRSFDGSISPRKAYEESGTPRRSVEDAENPGLAIEGGVTPRRSLEGGLTPRNVVHMGATPRRDLEEGLPSRNAVDSGATPRRSLEGGLTPRNVVRMGATPRRDLEEGLPSRNVVDSGATPRRSLEGGLTPRDVVHMGATPRRDLEESLPSRNVDDAGATPRRSLDGSLPPRNVVDAGATPRRSLEGGLPPRNVVDAGATPRRSLEGGLTPRNVVDAGATPRRSLEGGLTPRNVVDAGATPRRSLEGGLTPRNVVNMGATPRRDLEESLPPRNVVDVEATPRRTLEGGLTPLNTFEGAATPQRQIGEAENDSRLTAEAPSSKANKRKPDDSSSIEEMKRYLSNRNQHVEKAFPKMNDYIERWCQAGVLPAAEPKEPGGTQTVETPSVEVPPPPPPPLQPAPGPRIRDTGQEEGYYPRPPPKKQKQMAAYAQETNDAQVQLQGTAPRIPVPVSTSALAPLCQLSSPEDREKSPRGPVIVSPSRESVVVDPLLQQLRRSCDLEVTAVSPSAQVAEQMAPVPEIQNTRVRPFLNNRLYGNRQTARQAPNERRQNYGIEFLSKPSQPQSNVPLQPTLWPNDRIGQIASNVSSSFDAGSITIGPARTLELAGIQNIILQQQLKQQQHQKEQQRLLQEKQQSQTEQQRLLQEQQQQQSQTEQQRLLQEKQQSQIEQQRLLQEKQQSQIEQQRLLEEQQHQQMVQQWHLMQQKSQRLLEQQQLQQSQHLQHQQQPQHQHQLYLQQKQQQHQVHQQHQVNQHQQHQVRRQQPVHHQQPHHHQLYQQQQQPQLYQQQQQMLQQQQQLHHHEHQQHHLHLQQQHQLHQQQQQQLHHQQHHLQQQQQQQLDNQQKSQQTPRQQRQRATKRQQQKKKQEENLLPMQEVHQVNRFKPWEQTNPAYIRSVVNPAYFFHHQMMDQHNARNLPPLHPHSTQYFSQIPYNHSQTQEGVTRTNPPWFITNPPKVPECNVSVPSTSSSFISPTKPTTSVPQYTTPGPLHLLSGVKYTTTRPTTAVQRAHPTPAVQEYSVPGLQHRQSKDQRLTAPASAAELQGNSSTGYPMLASVLAAPAQSHQPLKFPQYNEPDPSRPSTPMPMLSAPVRGRLTPALAGYSSPKPALPSEYNNPKSSAPTPQIAASASHQRVKSSPRVEDYAGDDICRILETDMESLNHIEMQTGNSLRVISEDFAQAKHRFQEMKKELMTIEEDEKIKVHTQSAVTNTAAEDVTAPAHRMEQQRDTAVHSASDGDPVIQFPYRCQETNNAFPPSVDFPGQNLVHMSGGIQIQIPVSGTKSGTNDGLQGQATNQNSQPQTREQVQTLLPSDSASQRLNTGIVVNNPQLDVRSQPEHSARRLSDGNAINNIGMTIEHRLEEAAASSVPSSGPNINSQRQNSYLINSNFVLPVSSSGPSSVAQRFCGGGHNTNQERNESVQVANSRTCPESRRQLAEEMPSTSPQTLERMLYPRTNSIPETERLQSHSLRLASESQRQETASATADRLHDNSSCDEVDRLLNSNLESNFDYSPDINMQMLDLFDHQMMSAPQNSTFPASNNASQEQLSNGSPVHPILMAQTLEHQQQREDNAKLHTTQELHHLVEQRDPVRVNTPLALDASYQESASANNEGPPRYCPEQVPYSENTHNTEDNTFSETKHPIPTQQTSPQTVQNSVLLPPPLFPAPRAIKLSRYASLQFLSRSQSAPLLLPSDLKDSNSQPPSEMPCPPPLQPRPSNRATQPFIQIEQPLNQTTQPLIQNEQPLNQTTQPLIQNEQPLNQTTQPLFRIEQPLNQTTQPLIQNEQPLNQTTQPLFRIEQPLNQTTQPLIQNKQPLNQTTRSLIQNEHLLNQTTHPFIQNEQPLNLTTHPTATCHTLQPPPAHLQDNPQKENNDIEEIAIDLSVRASSQAPVHRRRLHATDTPAVDSKEGIKQLSTSLSATSHKISQDVSHMRVIAPNFSRMVDLHERSAFMSNIPLHPNSSIPSIDKSSFTEGCVKKENDISLLASCEMAASATTDENAGNLSSIIDTPTTVNPSPIIETSVTVNPSPIIDTSATVNPSPIIDTPAKVNLSPIIDTPATVNPSPIIDTSATVNPSPIIDTSAKVNLSPIIDTPATVNPSPIIDTSAKVNPSPIIDTSATVNPSPIIDTSAKVNLSPIIDTPATVNPSPIIDTSAKVNPSPLIDISATVNPSPIKDTPATVNPSPIIDTSATVNPSPIIDTSATVKSSPIIDTPATVNPSPIIDTPATVNPSPIIDTSATVNPSPIIDTSAKVNLSPIIDNPATVNPSPIIDTSATVNPSPLINTSATVNPSPIIDTPATVNPSPIIDTPGTVNPSPIIDTSATVNPSPIIDTPATVNSSPIIDTPATVNPSPIIDTSATVNPSSIIDTSATVNPSPIIDTSATVNPSPLIDISATVNPSPIIDTSATVNPSPIIDYPATVNPSPPSDNGAITTESIAVNKSESSTPTLAVVVPASATASEPIVMESADVSNGDTPAEMLATSSASDKTENFAINNEDSNTAGSMLDAPATSANEENETEMHAASVSDGGITNNDIQHSESSGCENIDPLQTQSSNQGILPKEHQPEDTEGSNFPEESSSFRLDIKEFEKEDKKTEAKNRILNIKKEGDLTFEEHLSDWGGTAVLSDTVGPSRNPEISYDRAGPSENSACPSENLEMSSNSAGPSGMSSGPAGPSGMSSDPAGPSGMSSDSARPSGISSGPVDCTPLDCDFSFACCKVKTENPKRVEKLPVPKHFCIVCKNRTQYCCGRCARVYYCSEECQNAMKAAMARINETATQNSILRHPPEGLQSILQSTSAEDGINSSRNGSEVSMQTKNLEPAGE